MVLINPPVCTLPAMTLPEVLKIPPVCTLPDKLRLPPETLPIILAILAPRFMYVLKLAICFSYYPALYVRHVEPL